jgi:hypothetical protein
MSGLANQTKRPNKYIAMTNAAVRNTSALPQPGRRRRTRRRRTMLVAVGLVVVGLTAAELVAAELVSLGTTSSG